MNDILSVVKLFLLNTPFWNIIIENVILSTLLKLWMDIKKQYSPDWRDLDGGKINKYKIRSVETL